VDVVVARGFSSVSYIHDARTRILHNLAAGKQTVLLYFGDLDPSGWEMLPAMLDTLEEMDLQVGADVIGHRCALTEDQVNQYNLPKNPDALKPKDSRARKYMAQFGDLAVELDALSPPDLEALVKSSIEGFLDKSLFDEEEFKQEQERTLLVDLKSEVHTLVEGKDIDV
jgi:hypothetical protein